ncbi:MAG: TRAP transporter small permease [Betaproteobacteria bacterium]|nr:TRAP transporter small permease [Betaproteobacteria bacterium]NBO43551.1 TRAP transporter small permease [Betaproteobacteria bacterium]NBP10541.1 TRAP transporter small permease [Betaproteobacteria bacterium]NBP61679.1 TRAP transporter small permease [Betaproteobacteria bacterium]NBQ08661.1 TRAP transporter small permease [Betaproteobacteria bacterium]
MQSPSGQGNDDVGLRVEEENVDFSGVPWEAWVGVFFFALLAAVVLTQFVTRYVLNDSASWTEEIARYLLVATVFSGAAIGVARNNHIQVDFVYRYLPKQASRILASLVDVLRTAFFIAMVYLCYRLIEKLGASRMTVIDLPIGMLYWVCFGGFAAMALRSLQISAIHWRRGYSVLERPESSMQDR